MKLRKPEAWENTALEVLATLTLGGDWGKDPEFDSADYTAALCIRGSEFRNWNEDRGRTASLRKVKKTSLASRALRIGDILVEISGGGPDQPVGRTVLIDKISLSHSPNLPKICTNFLRLFRPSGEIDSCYLNLFLQFFYKSGDIRAYQAGSNNLRNLKFDDYLGIEIPIPPLADQHRIVVKIEELFSELDKGIENLKTAQAQLKVYRQSLLKHAFEGKLTAQWRADNPDKLESADALLKRIQKERERRYRQQVADWEAAGKPGSKPKAPKPLAPLTAEELADLPVLPMGWKWVKLGELTWSVKDGPHFSPKYADEGIPFISGGNVRPDGVDFTTAKFISRKLHEELSRRCKPEVGDLLYTKGGTTGIARVNTYDVDFNVWVHVAVLKLTSAVKPFYLQHALNSSFCYTQSQKFTHGVGNQDLGLTRMVNIVFAICSLAEQEEVIGVVDDKMSVIDQLDKTITDSLQQAEALRQSILKKAFSGQLVPQDPTDEPASALLARIKADKSAQPISKKARK